MTAPLAVEPMAAVPPPATESVELIPLESCKPASYNPRTFPAKPSAQLVELAMSIRRTGQVQPATVRPIVGGYEIVAGERRWRACRLRAKGETELTPADAWVGDGAQSAALIAAGPPVEVLRAVVRELTDEQAMEVCAVENLEREDLQPLEEANGVATLLQLYKGDVEAVAARVSRPVSWVAARARLLTLSPAWRKALGDERRGFHTWTAAHLVEISKLAPAAQDDFLKDLYHAADMTVAELKKLVVSELRTLGHAPFAILDAALVPKVGACSTCPTTSASTPGLFVDEGDELAPTDLKKARCLNPGCWTGKAAAGAKAKLAELRKEHKEAATVFEQYDDKRALPQHLQEKALRVGEYSEYQRVKAGTAGAWPGVYAGGAKAGTVEWFVMRESGRGGGGRQKRAPGGEKKVTPLAERRTALARRRIVAAVVMAQKAIEECDAVPPAAVLLTLASVFGTKAKADALGDYFYMPDEDDGPLTVRSSRGADRWKVYDKAAGLTAAARDSDLWKRQLRPVLMSRLNYQGTHTVAKLLANAKRAGGLVGVNVDALYKLAIAELPEPKSWKALAEQEKAAKKPKRPAPATSKKKSGKVANAQRGKKS